MEPLFLLIPFGLVLVIGLVFLHYSSRHRPGGGSELASGFNPSGGMDALSDPCLGNLLRPPKRWIAIRDSNLAAVVEALGVRDATPCTWLDTLVRREDHRLFLAPPVHGWILLTGTDLPDPADDPDQAFHFLVRLSERIGEVHYYGSDPTLGHHAWVRAEAGRIIRAYAWAGETLWNQGLLTTAERKLGIHCRDYGHGEPGGPVVLTHVDISNAEKVYRLAACWSIDPLTLGESTIVERQGLMGRLISSGLL